MKRIGILTFHFSQNSGAVLQTYALQQTLNNLGYEAYVIDYTPEEMEKLKYKKYKILPNKKKLPLKLKICIIGRLIYNFFCISKRITEYENFIKDKFKLTPKIGKDALKRLNFDTYVVGSDQIWNEEITCGFDDAYFGEFVTKNKTKVISYAASLGENKIIEEEKFKRLLKNLHAISLREKSSVNFVKQYTDKDVVDVLDPTLLVLEEEWKEKLNLNVSKEKFVLFCIINQKEKDLMFAKKLAKEKKLKLILLEDYKKIKNFNLKTSINTPYEFLRLIKNAEYVVTDSFHGVVFSIIFKKQFFVIKRERKFLRIENLLDKLKIKGRIIGEEIQEIDYDNVYKILEKEREKSIEYLKDSLKEN